MMGDKKSGKSRLDYLLERRAAEKTRKILEAEAKKKPHGGKRTGAGRKPNFLKNLGMPPATANEILSHFDLPRLWASLLNCKSEETRLKALVYLYDRVYGKPLERGEFASAGGTAISVQFVGVSDEQLKYETDRIQDRLGLVLKSAPEPTPAA